MRNLIPLLLFVNVFGTEACEQKFDEFLKKFESIQGFQIEETNYPLDVTYLDLMADPEPIQVRETILKDQMLRRTNPIFPIESKGITRKHEEGLNKYMVTLTKVDTGLQLLYTFKRFGGCWKLSGLDDKST